MTLLPCVLSQSASQWLLSGFNERLRHSGKAQNLLEATVDFSSLVPQNDKVVLSCLTIGLCVSLQGLPKPFVKQRES